MLKPNKLKKNIKISDTSSTFKLWSNTPAKIYRKFYIFHVQNPKEVQEGKSKPILVEKGPYVYSEVILLTWDSRLGKTTKTIF